MVLRLHKKRSPLVMLFFFFLLQQVFLEYSSGIVKRIISYADEVTECALILLLVLSFVFKKIKLSKVESTIIVCFFVFAALGLVSNLVHPMQSWFLNLTDMLVCARIIVFYFAVRILLDGKVDSRLLLMDMAKLCRFLAVVMGVLALHDILFSPWFPKRDFRYFMYSLQLFFPHPTYMAVACMTCGCLLMAAMEFCETPKEMRFNRICIWIFLALTFCTLRSKAMAAVACSVALYFLVVKWKVKSKVFLVGGGSLLAMIIGWDQLQFYFSTNSSSIVRARLVSDSIRLANEYFPLGTGFATFGSALAAEHYSPLYLRLGFNVLHGGSRTDTRYLSDSFWPTVIAQTGWIGTIAFVGIVICIAVIVFRAQKKSRYIFWSMLSMLLYELIASTSESAFFNPTAALLMAVFALLVNISPDSAKNEPKQVQEAPPENNLNQHD